MTQPLAQVLVTQGHEAYIKRANKKPLKFWRCCCPACVAKREGKS